MEDPTPLGVFLTRRETQKGIPGLVYLYAAHFVCGDLPTGFPGPLGAPLGGRYETRINILNPLSDDTHIQKCIALTTPPAGQEPGAVSEWIGEPLPAGAALSVTCQEIMAEFTFPMTKGVPKFTLAYREGFLNIASSTSLDVTAVYTVAGVDGAVGSIHVEQVNERILDLR